MAKTYRTALDNCGAARLVRVSRDGCTMEEGRHTASQTNNIFAVPRMLTRQAAKGEKVSVQQIPLVAAGHHREPVQNVEHPLALWKTEMYALIHWSSAPVAPYGGTLGGQQMISIPMLTTGAPRWPCCGNAAFVGLAFSEVPASGPNAHVAEVRNHDSSNTCADRVRSRPFVKCNEM
jgi:hypothetical protein